MLSRASSFDSYRAAASESGYAPGPGLLLAAREGDIGRVARWLRLGAPLDAVDDDDGSSPLLVAASSGHLWVVNKLLDAGANLEAVNHRGETPLLGAAAGGHLEVVDKLLDAGASVDASNGSGDTALIAAAMNAHLGVVRTLLQKGADPDAVNESGDSALMLAEAFGHADVAEALREVTESPQQFFRNVAYGSVDSVRSSVDRYLHTRGSRGCTPVLVAAQHDQFEMLKLLVFRGANVEDRDEAGWTALHFAAQRGSTDMIKFLLSQQAKPNVVDESGLAPIDIAARHGHLAAVKELHDQGASISNTAVDGRSILHHAASSASANAGSIVRYLLDQGADVNVADASGWTVLHLAIQSGSTATCEMVLGRGADVNACTKFDCGSVTVRRADSALHLAVQYGHLGIAQLLLRRDGIQMDGLNHCGRTPLLDAVVAAHNEIAIALISAGANPDAGDDDGTTPLLVACSAKSDELVQALLQHGARVDVMTKFGNTPLKATQSDDIRSVLSIYQSSQRFHDRCVALLGKNETPPSVDELLALVPLVTSVYDLRMLLTLSFAARSGSEQRVDALLKVAFGHVLTHKLVLDDDACVFFRLVLERCVDTKLISPSDYMRWKVQATKVNMESAEWVVELKKQVHHNSWRLGVHDHSIQLVADGMKEIHAMVLENRAAVLTVASRVKSLQDQVDAGKKVLAGLVDHSQRLSSRMDQFQQRLDKSEENIVAVASSLQSFRTAYADRIEHEKKTKMLRMGCGLVASLVGFAFAPLLKEVFDSVIDFANPVEILNHAYNGNDDLASFLADSSSEYVLSPAVEDQLTKFAISKDEFETALRQELVVSNPELVKECEQRGLSVDVAVGDPKEVQALIPSLDAEEKLLENAIEEIRAAAVAVRSKVKSKNLVLISEATINVQPEVPSLHKSPPSNQVGDLPVPPESKQSEKPPTDEVSARGDTKRTLEGAVSNQDAGTAKQRSNGGNEETLEFVDELHEFPFHFAVHSSNGDLDSFLELTEVIDTDEDDPNATMEVNLVTRSSAATAISAAEYAYLLGYREVGDLVAAKMKDPVGVAGVSSATSVTLLGDVHEFPFVFAVHESQGDVNECESLLEVVDEAEDAVDARIRAEVVHEDRRERERWSAVELACHLGYVDIVKHLLVKKRVKTLLKSVVVLQRAKQRAAARHS